MNFDELSTGACYRKRRSKRPRKKTVDGKYVMATKRGLRKGKEKDSAQVREVNCPLKLLLVGHTALELGRSRERKI